jgi:hypothetical protein
MMYINHFTDGFVFHSFFSGGEWLGVLTAGELPV